MVLIRWSIVHNGVVAPEKTKSVCMLDPDAFAAPRRLIEYKLLMTTQLVVLRYKVCTREGTNSRSEGSDGIMRVAWDEGHLFLVC